MKSKVDKGNQIISILHCLPSYSIPSIQLKAEVGHVIGARIRNKFLDMLSNLQHCFTNLLLNYQSYMINFDNNH